MNQKLNSIKIFLLCPIPDEQKPISEYINLKKFITEKRITKFTILQLSQTYIKKKDEVIQNFFKEFKQIIVGLFLFVRWNEIKKRLNLPNIIYEEGSWYDSQIWEKPFSMIKNDRLINSQIIKPYFKLVFISFYLCLFMILCIFIINNL